MSTDSLGLNIEQRAAYEAIVAGKNIFLTGPGGTGKSFLLNVIYETIRKKVALTAMTGCAAMLIHPKAKTLHSWASIGLAKDSAPLLISSIKKSRRSVMRWMSADILVVDEVSMMTPDLFEKLNDVAKSIRKCQLLFGGLQLVFVGDFFQLPPVSKEKDVPFVFESPLWKDTFITHELTQIVRQKDPIFQEVLQEARQGELTKKSLKILSKRISIDFKDNAIKPTMLFTRRAEVDHINMSHLRKLITERKTFKASTEFLPIAQTDGYKPDNPDIVRAIQKLDSDASYTNELTLAIGAQVMLLINKPDLMLVNGSRGVVNGYKEVEGQWLPVVEFRNGTKIPIEPNTWELPDFPGVLRKQIPLRLAYAITIHKAQGATLDCALIDVGDSTFEFGQAYVALSRVKDLDSLYIHDLDSGAFRAHPKVKEFYSVIDKHI